MKKIVNADDFGASLSVNEAIDYCFNHDLINRTTIMVNMPGFQDAIEKSKRGNYFQHIGLHLNLDAGVPLTDGIKKFDLFGDKTFWKKRHNRYFIFNRKARIAIRAEISAQMDKYVGTGFPLMHIDSHHHIHTMPSILPIVISEAKRHGFTSMRISRNMGGCSGVKQIIKQVINYLIRCNFSTTRYFGGYNDFQQSKFPLHATTEIMVHPKIIDGNVVNMITNRKGPLYIKMHHI